MIWAEVRFEELYDVPSRNGIYKEKQFHGSGIRIVNMGELFAFDFVNGQEMQLVQLTDAEMERCTLRSGDLLFGRRSLVEAGAGKCSIVRNVPDPITFESSIIRVRLDPEKADPLFYYYWLKSSRGRGRVLSIVTGTNVKGIRGTDLLNIMVPQPALEIQRRIASILSAYDDLIENNRKRIKLLERAARLLYREWFVRLRFPGHEGVKVKDGVPEGWEKVTIDQVAETIGGGTPKTAVREYWEDGEVTWFSPRDLTANGDLVILDSEKKITERGYESCSAKLLPPEAILMTSRATIGVFALCDKPCATNQGFISLIPRKDNTRMYILFNLMSRKDELLSNAQGSTFAEISKSTFRALSILMPSRDVLSKFESLVYDMIKQIRVLKKQNAALTRARDLLLPRLMSGKVKV